MRLSSRPRSAVAALVLVAFAAASGASAAVRPRPARRTLPTLESPARPPDGTVRATAPYYFGILQDKARKIEERNTTEGWAYVVSGGLALAISIPGYYLSEDVFARSVYSLGETLAVGAVGYGAYQLLVSDDYARFVRILESSPTLSGSEKEKLAYEFMNENAKRARALRRIRVISHGLTAGLNVLNGATSGNRELRTALYFIGAINVLAALSFLVKQSEEEAFLDEVRGGRRLEAFLGAGEGPLLGLRYSF